MTTKIRSAFTLIELLVVISVIGILSGILIGILNPGYLQGRARNAARKADLGVIQSALEMYYSDQNLYPASIPSGTWTGYLTTVPVDPKTATAYSYTQTGSGVSYDLCATLEPSGSYCVHNPF